MPPPDGRVSIAGQRTGFVGRLFFTSSPFSMSPWFRVSFLTGLGRVEGKSELFLIPMGQPLQVLKLVRLLPLNTDGFRISLLSCLCLFFFSSIRKLNLHH